MQLRRFHGRRIQNRGGWRRRRGESPVETESGIGTRTHHLPAFDAQGFSGIGVRRMLFRAGCYRPDITASDPQIRLRIINRHLPAVRSLTAILKRAAPRHRSMVRILRCGDRPGTPELRPGTPLRLAIPFPDPTTEDILILGTQCIIIQLRRFHGRRIQITGRRIDYRIRREVMHDDACAGPITRLQDRSAIDPQLCARTPMDHLEFRLLIIGVHPRADRMMANVLLVVACPYLSILRKNLEAVCPGHIVLEGPAPDQRSDLWRGAWRSPVIRTIASPIAIGITDLVPIRRIPRYIEPSLVVLRVILAMIIPEIAGILDDTLRGYHRRRRAIRCEMHVNQFRGSIVSGVEYGAEIHIEGLPNPAPHRKRSLIVDVYLIGR